MGRFTLNGDRNSSGGIGIVDVMRFLLAFFAIANIIVLGYETMFSLSTYVLPGPGMNVTQIEYYASMPAEVTAGIHQFSLEWFVLWSDLARIFYSVMIFFMIAQPDSVGMVVFYNFVVGLLTVADAVKLIVYLAAIQQRCSNYWWCCTPGVPTYTATAQGALPSFAFINLWASCIYFVSQALVCFLLVIIMHRNALSVANPAADADMEESMNADVIALQRMRILSGDKVSQASDEDEEEDEKPKKKKKHHKSTSSKAPLLGSDIKKRNKNVQFM